MSKKTKISVDEYAANHNPVLSRRHKPMTASYIYRLIRHTEAGICKRKLWFKYVMEGDKDRIFIEL